MAEKLARHQDWHAWVQEKRRRRLADEQVKPLEAYRGEEMARSHECFFGDDRSYHEARMRFVYKLGAPCVVAPVAPQPEAAKEFVVTTSAVPAPPAPVVAPEPARLEAVPAPPVAFVATTESAAPAPAPAPAPAAEPAKVEPPAEVGWRLVSNS
jgi:hypothetical protein